MLFELGFERYLPKEGKIHLFGDNQSSLSLANNPENHQRTKHIDVQYHYTRELISTGALSTKYCPTKAMIADPLTKPLPRAIFEPLISQILGRTCSEAGFEPGMWEPQAPGGDRAL